MEAVGHRMGFNYDAEQKQAIATDGHVLVAACPGSGKTGTLAARGARLLASGSGTLVAVSFTQDSAKELRSRVIAQAPAGSSKRVVSGTFHSIALRMLQESGARRVRVINGGESFSLLKKAMTAVRWRDGWDHATDCLERAKSTLRPAETIESRELLGAYDSLLASIGAIDFGSMLQRCVSGLRDGSIKPLVASWLLVDEAQDMDEVQLEWVKLHARAGVSVTMVGDDDQCHPEGVMLATATGDVAVESLYGAERAARLLSMHRRGRTPNGDALDLRATARYAVSCRQYDGEILTVAAGGFSTPCTPNHRWYVRWSPAAKDGWGVYLVRCKRGWLLYSGPIAPSHFWPKRKMREVGGNALWVLSVASSATEAAAQARTLRTHYGLTATFEPGQIAAAARQAATDRAEMLLKDSGLYVEWPFLGQTRHKYGRARGLVVTSTNIIPGMMFVPARSEGRSCVWREIDRITRSRYKGLVYSLDVPTHELYVANGLVTHNSIYGWRHSMGIAGMESFEKEMAASRVVLQSNYRSAPEIVDAARLLILNNRMRLEKASRATKSTPGTIEVGSYFTRGDETAAILTRVREQPERWAVLARTNSLLRRVQTTLEGQVPYTMSGGTSIWDSALAGAFKNMLLDIEQGHSARSVVQALLLTNVLDPAAAKRLEGHRDASFDVLAANAERIIAGDDARRRRGGALQDLRVSWPAWVRNLQAGRAELVIFGVTAWFKRQLPQDDDKEMTDFIAEAILRRKGSMPARFMGLGAKDETTDGVRLLTMHAAKGLEFDQCWVMACEDGVCPNLESELEEERRLFYVAMTRARETLVFSYTLGDKVKLSRFLQEAKVVAG